VRAMKSSLGSCPFESHNRWQTMESSLSMVLLFQFACQGELSCGAAGVHERCIGNIRVIANGIVPHLGNHRRHRGACELELLLELLVPGARLGGRVEHGHGKRAAENE
jgi:hypothetical protein